MSLLGGGLVLLGVLVALIGALGLWRFEDVFMRSHAASVADTLGAGLVVLGLAFLTTQPVVWLKLAFLLLFLLFSAPTAAHALAQAALHDGVTPKLPK